MRNREIKFRAWDKEGKYMTTSGFFVVNTDGTLQSHEKCIVMQFTGLHDCDDNEIWEGDIMTSGGHPTQVIWNPNRGIFGITTGQYELGAYNKTMKVIGNIYQNPKLLKI